MTTVPAWCNRQIAEFIKDQQRRGKVLFEFRFEAAGRLSRSEGVDRIDGGRE